MTQPEVAAGTARQPGQSWSFRGAPVVLVRGWWLGFLVLGLLFFPSWRDNWGFGTIASVGLTLVQCGFLAASILIHELSHAEVAHRCGRIVESVSLTFWGGLTVSRPRGLGVEGHGRAALIAAAGPASNLVVSALAWMTLTLWSEPATLKTAVLWQLLRSLMLFNLALGLFNMLPGYPMDGGHVLESFIARLTGRASTGRVVAGWTGRVLAIGVVAIIILPDVFRGNRPDALSAMWGIFIAFFLWSGASSALATAPTMRNLEKFRLGPLLRPIVVLQAQDALDVVRRELDAQGGPNWAIGLVAHENCVINLEAVAAVPEGQWAHTTASAVMVPTTIAMVDLAPGSDVETVSSTVVEASAEFALVFVRQTGHVIGGVLASDVSRAIVPQRAGQG